MVAGDRQGREWEHRPGRVEQTGRQYDQGPICSLGKKRHKILDIYPLFILLNIDPGGMKGFKASSDLKRMHNVTEMSI